MVKLQDKVKFVDDMGKSFTGTVVKVNSNKTLDIKVKRKIGNGPQIFMRVPKEIKDQENKPKPRYTELSTPKEIKDNEPKPRYTELSTPKKKE